MKKPGQLQFTHEEFEALEPLGAPPMGGIEKFTIRHVGNPLIVGGKVAPELVGALFLSMQKKIMKYAAVKTRHEIKFSRIVFEPKLSPKTDQFGRVEMEVISSARYETVDRVSEILVGELFSSCEQNVSVVVEAFDLFWGRLVQLEYTPQELMSTLLVCIEERQAGKLPQIISNTAKPSAIPVVRIDIARADIDKEHTGGGRIGIRVVSIREMLRSYFEKYPDKYHYAIERAVGMRHLRPDKIEDIIEAQIERIGVWEFAVNVWMQVRGWSQEQERANGIIEPLDEDEQWILCPRWDRKGITYDISELVHMIATHYAKT